MSDERNLSNVEEIGTCSYINHIINMTTLYIQQVGLLPFFLSSHFACQIIYKTALKVEWLVSIRRVKPGVTWVCVCLWCCSSRARPKRRRWQIRAKQRSLSDMHWLFVKAFMTLTTTGGIEPAGNNIQQQT